jgi:hypothetical protein
MKPMDIQNLAFASGQGRVLWLLGDLYTFKTTGHGLSVVELKAFPQNGPPPHIHGREDESFWVLDGQFSVLLGTERLTVGPDAFVHVPRATPGRMIVMLTPGGFEKFWEELGVPAVQTTTPPPPDPGILDRILKLAPKYHLEIPPPPE